MQMKKQIGVIGGGAAGMMAAITAAKEGAQVTILERNDRVGKENIADRKREMQSGKSCAFRGVLSRWGFGMDPGCAGTF